MFTTSLYESRRIQTDLQAQVFNHEGKIERHKIRLIATQVLLNDMVSFLMSYVKEEDCIPLQIFNVK